jgi:hypothetical protein
VRVPSGMFSDLCDRWIPPGMRRGLSVTLAFMGFGLVAGASGLALIAADNDTDPRSAFAFSPVQPARVETAVKAPADMPRVETVMAREVTGADIIRPCAGKPGDDADRCVSDAASKPRTPDPVSAPATAAEAVTADTPRPAVSTSEPAVSVASAPAPEEDAPSKSAERVAPLVEEAVLPAPAAKPQKTARQQGGRRYAQSSAPRRSRYAQHFWPFW